ncbi:MAG: lanthionine synthetase LanC family protein, partial [Pseudonocardiaceae bacterium]
PGTWDTEGPTLCHGSAGVLLCADVTGSTTTADAALKELTAQYDPRLPFFFQHRDHGQATNEPGLLVGAAGIALTLADRSELATYWAPTAWTAALLLAMPCQSSATATTEGGLP